MIVANVVDVLQRRIFPARVAWRDGRIVSVESVTDSEAAGALFLMPGFIDAHVHVESSMIPPREFARMAVIHGTVGTVSDPHEIANVLGMEGVDFMLTEARDVPFGFCFGAPSCVPATAFETAGAVLDAADVGALMERKEIGYLSEVMNFPGVVAGDPDLIEKIRHAHRHSKPVDGHCPGLGGEDLRKYVATGISTDHECATLDEALEKIAAGMKILVREGSAARNFGALETLLTSHPEACMLCSDDKHPDELAERHVNGLVLDAIAAGHELFDVLRVACVNPVRHYGLDPAFLRVGDPATFLVVDDLKSLRIRETWIRGECVAKDGASRIPWREPACPNRFVPRHVTPQDFSLPSRGPIARVIDVEDGQLLTRSARIPVSKLTDDVVKLAVVNRYRDAPPAVALARGIGLRRGAIASTVAHDCHNIVAAGCDEESLARAVNALMDSRGGCVAVDGDRTEVLPLPIAGLMSALPGEDVAAGYTRLTAMAHAMGSPLGAPFMTLSFLALLVIPELKLSDRGLFDGRAFEFVPVFE